jgi:hypothetical protein
MISCSSMRRPPAAFGALSRIRDSPGGVIDSLQQKTEQNEYFDAVNFLLNIQRRSPRIPVE